MLPKNLFVRFNSLSASWRSTKPRTFAEPRRTFQSLQYRCRLQSTLNRPVLSILCAWTRSKNMIHHSKLAVLLLALHQQQVAH